MKIKLTNTRSFSRKRLFLFIMRMMIFLLCTTVFSFTTTTAFSQEKVFINQDQILSVDEVFKIIQQQTDYHFIYPKKLFKNSPSLQVKKGEILLSNLLDKALKNSVLKYELDENNTILIKKAEITYNKRQERINISGVVTDPAGMPLPGVTVLIKGTSRGFVTDFNGAYNISVEKDAVIEFRYIGFVNQTISVADLTFYNNVNISLKEDINALEEVVVTGYQTLTKERTAGSFDKVEAEVLQQRPSSVNIIDRLVGQVSGLNISPVDGSFEIRGRGTILNGLGSPLIVVDGFPLAEQENFESINAEDIESVTILKDASASSIWGSRASNGVVVIVTKKGTKNTPLSIDLSTFVEFENKVDLDDFNWLTTSQEMDLDQEFIDKNWVNLRSLADSPGSINDFHLAQIYRDGFSPDGNRWSQNTYDNYINELRQRDVTKDWEKYLIRSAMRKTYNLSISGGGNRNSFFGSLSYTTQDEQSVGESNDRITMNLRNVFEFNDKISFTTAMTAALRSEENNSLTSYYGRNGGSNVTMAALAQPYDQLIDENGQYVQKYFNWNPWISQEREALIGSPHTFNFLEEQRNHDSGRSQLDLRADFILDVEVLKGLKLTSSFRYERNNNDVDNYNSMTLPSHRNLVNDHYVQDSNGRYVNGIPVGSEYLQNYTYTKGWVFKNTLNWDKTWGNHQLTAFAGGEYNRRFTETSLNRQFGYDKQTTTYIPINITDLLGRRIENFQGTPYTRYFNSNTIFDINNYDYRFVSMFSNMSYTYKGKYTFNGSFRIDQANIFGSSPDFRYKPLWSLGAAWDVSKESFLDDASWIDRLKLRATYGLGGNSVYNISPYPSARNRNINWGYDYVSLVLNQPGNPGLKWEETATTNIAVDFALFDNRISGSFDYYTKKSTDVIGRRELDPTVGFASALVNYANIENNGWELVLNADIVRSQDFNWSIRANINTNKNEVTSYEGTGSPSPDQYTIGSAIVEGKPIRPLYGYNFAGLDNNGEVLLFDLDGNTKSWRDPIEVEELVYKGSRVPKYYGGLSTTFNYKGIDLTVNMNYQAGFVFRPQYNYASTGYGTYNNDDYDFGNVRTNNIWADRWIQPGDEATTNVPKIFYNGLNPATGSIENRNDTSAMHRIWNQSTYTTLKGDYLRVQDIILGYTMPSKFLKPTFFKSLRLSTQVTNPFLWTANDLGIDPTVGYDQAFRNLTRFTLGVRATF